MENITDLNKMENMLKDRSMKKTKQLYDTVQESRTSNTHQPEEIIANLTTQLKEIHKTEITKEPVTGKRSLVPKQYLKSEFVNISMLLEDNQLLQNPIVTNNKFETQCFSDTQLINVVENAEAINVENGFTQEFETTFQGHKDNENVATDNQTGVDNIVMEINNEYDNVLQPDSIMEIENEDESMNDTKDATNMSMVPNVSFNAGNIDDFQDIEMPSSPVLQCSKPTEQSKPLVFNLETFEKFESIAIPVVEENLNKSATKRLINTQMVDRELFLNINLEQFLFERDKSDSPVISLAGDDIIVNKDEYLNLNNTMGLKESENNMFDKKSDSLKDEILFSSDEDEDYAHKNLDELSFTCALENPYFDEPDNLDQNMYVGFQTASDKSIQICTNSFKKAQSILNNIDQNENNSVTELVGKHDSVNKNGNISQDVNNSNVSKVIFNKCCDNNVKSLDVAPSEGFKTASNKVIKLSEKALSRCLKVFKDINLDEEFNNPAVQDTELNDVVGEEKNIHADNEFNVSKIEDDCLLKEFENVEMSHEETEDINVVGVRVTNNISNKHESHNKYPIREESKISSKKDFHQNILQETKLNTKEKISGNSENVNVKFEGFKTAANKVITVSEKSLAHSKKMFEDLNDENLNENELINTETPNVAYPSFKGFQTASNKTVTVSKKALEKCKKVFEGLDNIEDLGLIETKERTLKNRDTSRFKEFQTLNNKSKDRLETNRKNDPVSDNSKDTHDPATKHIETPKFVGFQTASNKKVSISKTALERSKKIFQDVDKLDAVNSEGFHNKISTEEIDDQSYERKDLIEKTIESQTGFVGFKFASNKAVNISKEALQKSKKLFHDITEESNIELQERKPEIDSNRETNRNNANFENVQLGNELNIDVQSFVGFKTASNKNVKVSEKAYTESKNIFKDIFIEANKTIKSTDLSPAPNAEPVNVATHLKFQGFRTASNKQVNISEAAIKESKKIFDDIELESLNHNKDDKNSFTGFHTASNNKKIEVTTEALEKTKTYFQNIDSYPEKNDKCKSGFTFQTGNKKQVTVSEDSLHKVRNCAEKDSKNVKSDLYKSSNLNINVGFKTGNNRNVKILEEALKLSKTLLDSNQDMRNKKSDKKLDKNISISKQDVDSIIDTQVLNNFEQTLNTEDFCKTPTVPKRSGSPILSCPKAKRRKIFETPYCKNKTITKNKPINIVKPIVQNAAKIIFAVDYKKNKRLKLIEIDKLNNGNESSSIDPYLLKFHFNNLSEFEFIDNRNDLTDFKILNIESLKHIFIDNVDCKIVPNGWFENHIKLILWKLISYEIKFPNVFNGVCTAKNVINQLKYRYDRELHKAERPAIRKILEKDDVPGKTIVLSVVAVYVDGVSVTSIPQSYTSMELEVTDGWYTVKTTIDKMLANLTIANKIKVGSKLVTNGAELLNCEQGVAPWENTAAVRLKIFGNSTRRARWDARLGYHSNAAILTQLSSVKPEGGKVSKIRAFVARVYPTLYVEKFEDGSTVTRSERLENLYQMRHENERQAIMEKAYEEVEREICDQTLSQDSDTISDSKKRKMETGSQIAHYMKKCNDPAEFRSHLTESQLKLLQEHTTKRREKLLQDIQTRVLEKINKDGVGVKRNVVTLVKMRIVGLEERDGDVQITKAMMSIWKPSDAILEIVSEGSWVEVLNVVPTSVRYSELQISAGRQSVFQKSTCRVTENITRHTKLLQRSCFDIKAITQNPAMSTDYNEIDTIGMIFLIEPSIKEFDSTKESFQNVYLTDADKNLICVNFWGGIKKFGYENLLQIGVIIVCINLQKRAGNSRKSIPHYRVTEYTYFTKTPKDSVARKMVDVFENKFLGIDKCKFFDDCVSLKNNYAVIKSHNVDNVSPYRYNNSDYNLSKNKMFIDSPLAVNKNDDFNLTGLDFESTFKQNTQQLSPNTLIRKKKVMDRIERLKRYGEPPPISPITIINKSRNAASAYKSPLLSKADRSDSSLSVPDGKDRNLPNQTPKTTINDIHDQSSPILKLNRTYVKKSVNPVKLNFDSVAMKENDSSIDHFAEEFECSPPLSLD